MPTNSTQARRTGSQDNDLPADGAQVLENQDNSWNANLKKFENEAQPAAESQNGIALMIDQPEILQATKAFELEIWVQGSVVFFRPKGSEEDEEFYVPSAGCKIPVFGESEQAVLESELAASKVKQLLEIISETDKIGDRIWTEKVVNLHTMKFFKDYQNIKGMYFANAEELDALPAQNTIFLLVRTAKGNQTITARPILEGN